MRRIALAFTLLLAIASQAQALNTRDFLALVAMPLATAAASDYSGVSQSDLAAVVTDLNQANVPPVEYVQVVRYVPVALVQPRSNFVEYVNTETSQGLVGPSLADAIAQQLASNYGMTPVIDPNQTVVVDQIIDQPDYAGPPEIATTDPLSLALMPLAVAAVSDLNGVPQDQLATLVMTLNQANVPPTQFVQVMRYVPVALTDQNGQPFVAYVQQEVAQGVTGPALVPMIEQQLPSYGVPQQQIAVYAPPPRQQYTYAPPQAPLPIDDRTYFPQAVQERFGPAQTAMQMNPHGGPPGQLKRMEGVQTGAEVVHGFKPGHGRGRFAGGMPPGLERRQMEPPPPMTSAAPPMPMNVPQRIPPGQLKKMERQGQAPIAVQPQPGPPGGIPPGQLKKMEGGNPGNGHGHGNDNGHGHGHGKD